MSIKRLLSVALTISFVFEGTSSLSISAEFYAFKVDPAIKDNPKKERFFICLKFD
jgi:hypothetical protein